jgi:hypothetical protein
MNPLTVMTLVVPALAPPQAARAEEVALATYDLRDVMPRWDASPSWSQRLTLPPVANTENGPVVADGLDGLSYADLGSFELVDLLTQALGDEVRREGREMIVEGDKLTVLAPAAVQEQVRAVLTGLRAAMAGAVTVRVDVLSSEHEGAPTPAGVIGADEAAQLVATLGARGAKHESFQLELSAGRTSKLDAYRRVPFLFDYDVEISQAMMVFNPVMSEVRDGTRLVLRGLALPGGLALSLVLLRTELLGEPEKRPLTLRGMVHHDKTGTTELLPGPDGIQVPDALVTSLAFDTFLPEGKALCAVVQASLGDAARSAVVVIRREGGTMVPYSTHPIPRTNRTLIALEGELFRLPRLQPVSEPWVDAHGVRQPGLVASVGGEHSTFLLEWMKAHFSIWRRFGPWILIVTDPAWDRDAAAQLERLVRALAPETRLEDVELELVDPGREGAQPARARLPLLRGSSAALVVARGRTAVTGFDVEVAQGAAVPDPYVSALFEGLAVALELCDATCQAAGLAQLSDGPLAVLETGYGVLGPIALPAPRTLHFDERLELSARGVARIGGGVERGPGLALEIRIGSAER